MAVSWLINGGDPNHLLNGMILQVHALRNTGLIAGLVKGNQSFINSLLNTYFLIGGTLEGGLTSHENGEFGEALGKIRVFGNISRPISIGG